MIRLLALMLRKLEFYISRKDAEAQRVI